MKHKLLLLIAAMCCVGTIQAGSKDKHLESENYQKGVEASSAGNNEAAIDYFTKELKQNAKNGYAHSWLGHIYVQENQYDKALEEVNLAIKQIPKKEKSFLSSSYCDRATIHLELKDTISAIEDLKAAIKLDPDGPKYNRLGQIYFETGDHEKAVETYSELTTVEQGNPMAYVGVARSYYQMERYNDAVEQLNMAEKLSQKYTETYPYRAECYIAMGDWNKASDDIITAIKIDNNDHALDLYLNAKPELERLLLAKAKIQMAQTPTANKWPYYIGELYTSKADFNKAIEYYIKAIDAGAPAWVWRHVAEAYNNMGNNAQALACIDKAIEDSTCTKEMVRKSVMLRHAGKPLEAIAILDKLLEKTPDDGDLYYFKAFDVADTGDFAAAVDLMDKAIEQDKTNKHKYVLCALWCKEMGDEARARKYLDEMPQEGEEDAIAVYLQGNADKAVKIVNDEIETDTVHDGTSQLNAAYLYAVMGNNDQAIAHLRKAMEEHNVMISYYEADYLYRNIHDAPEFKALMKEYRTHYGVSEAEQPKVQEEAEVIEIPFTKENGYNKIKCTVNDLPMSVAFDPTAKNVTISVVEASFMLKNEYAEYKDVSNTRDVDEYGNVKSGATLNLKKVAFGGIELANVSARVVSQDSPIVLGPSALSRIGKAELDNLRLVLKITK